MVSCDAGDTKVLNLCIQATHIGKKAALAAKTNIIWVFFSLKLQILLIGARPHLQNTLMYHTARNAVGYCAVKEYFHLINNVHLILKNFLGGGKKEGVSQKKPGESVCLINSFHFQTPVYEQWVVYHIKH